MSYVLAVLVAAVVVVAIVAIVRRRRFSDTVATFQRQIDALSAEARRPVVDQVTQLERDDQPGAGDQHGESAEQHADDGGPHADGGEHAGGGEHDDDDQGRTDGRTDAP